MEKISVIIPVYNDEKHLEICLDSILKQTYSDLEIILVDDGSTDGTLDICEKYREKYDNIRVLHKENAGVGSSRNAGLAMATGDYILFVDSDDWLGDTNIEELYSLLKKNNADISVGNFVYFYEERGAFLFNTGSENYFEKVYTPQEWFKLEYSTEYKMDVIFTVPWGKLYKRALFENIAYPTNLDVGEDDFTTWKIYLMADKIAYMNKPVYFYRKYDDSVSSKPVSRVSPFAPTAAVEQRLSVLSQIGFDISQEQMAYRYRLDVALKDALENGDYIEYRDAKQKLAILDKYNKD